MAGLISLVIGVAWTAAVVLMLRGGQSLIERATPRRPGEYRLPSYVAATGLLSGAMAGAILALGWLGHVTPARHDFGAWLASLLCFGAAGAWMVIAAGNWRMWQSGAGVQIRSMLGTIQPFASWTNVARVRSNHWTSMVIFELRAGGRIKIPFHTPGLLTAVRAAHAHGALLDDRLAEELAGQSSTSEG